MKKIFKYAKKKYVKFREVLISVKKLILRNYKAWIAALLLTAGFTLWGTDTESLTFTIILCLAKIALIFGGGCLLIHAQEGEEC